MTLRFGDVPRLGLTGMRSRPGRTVLTALGIAIGIAALVSVVGISASSRADLLAELDRLGTNLLQVRAGQDVFGEDADLPEEAPDMVRRVGPGRAGGGRRPGLGHGAAHGSRSPSWRPGRSR